MNKISLQKIFHYAIGGLFLAIIVAGLGSSLLNIVKGGQTDRLRIYEIPQQITSYSTSTVLFVGDVMLDRAVRNRHSAFGGKFPFTYTADFIQSFDLAIANLEGPITTYPSKTVDYSNKALQFTFPPESANHLVQAGFDIVGIANNHGLDFGSEGIRQTLQFASSSGLIVYGDPRNDRNVSYSTQLANGAQLSVIGFHQFASNYAKIAEEIARIHAESKGQAIIIVTPHWGEEYQTDPTNFQRTMAEKWINLGADMVIGHHPHVIQVKEEIAGKPVYYSLGNFVFDQDFSVQTQTGLGLGISIVCKHTYIEGDTQSLQGQDSIKVNPQGEKHCSIPPRQAGGIQEYVFSIVKSEPRIISGTAIPAFVENLLDES